MLRRSTTLLLLFLAILPALFCSVGTADSGGDFVYIRDGKEYPFHWAADLFEKKAQIYNNDLAVASAVLSFGVEVPEKRPIQELFTACGIENLYLGCYDGDSSYKTWNEWGWGFQDGVFAIGHSILSVDTANDTTLLVVVGRGTMTPGEMGTDFFNNGNGSKFVAGKTVKRNISTYQRGMWQALEDYLHDHPVTTSKIKMLITGHSLGGAMANLFGARIIHDLDQLSWLNGKATADDIYVYTFGAIKVLDQEENVSEGYGNIHNIYNKHDSFGPEGNWGYLDVSSPDAKFGHTDLFARFFEESGPSTNCHDIENYLYVLIGNDMVHCVSSEGYEQDGSDGSSDVPALLTEEETRKLFTRLSRMPLHTFFGTGEPKGWLTVQADGTFEGYTGYASDGTCFEVSFSGAFSPMAGAVRNTYWLWVEEVIPRYEPGTAAYSVDGDPIVYDGTPFRAGEYLVLTLPGTPEEEIPFMAREEIGAVFGEWNDPSRFITLTRSGDSLGFFADPSLPSAVGPEPIATMAPGSFPPALTPIVSNDGDVLIDDEICTIVNLGKEMRPADRDLFPRPVYRLQITNRRNDSICIYPGPGNRPPANGIYGTVDGIVLDGIVFDVQELFFGGTSFFQVDAGATVEMALEPVANGYGFRSIDELMNTDVFISVFCTPMDSPSRIYELRMDTGPSSPRPAAEGYAAHAPECLDFSFELPDHWKIFYCTDETVSEVPLVLNDGSGTDLTLSLLPPPSLNTCSAGISMLFHCTPEEAALAHEGYQGCRRLADLSIDGRRAFVFQTRFSKTSAVLYELFLPGKEGTAIGIDLVTDGSIASNTVIGHFLNSIRFAGSADPARDTDADDGIWLGIWRSKDQDADRSLYIFRRKDEEGEESVCQMVLTGEKDGTAFGIEGELFFVDEITMDLYSGGSLHAGLVGGQGSITLTPFSALNDAIVPWMKLIEADYKYVGPLDDPYGQIPSSVRELVRHWNTIVQDSVHGS